MATGAEEHSDGQGVMREMIAASEGYPYGMEQRFTSLH